MDKQWVQKHISISNKEIDDLREKLVNEINSLSNEERKTKLLESFNEGNQEKNFWKLDFDVSFSQRFDKENLSSYEHIGQIVNKLIATMRNCTAYHSYLDSEPMEFDGDIIITDPCYIEKDDDDCVYNCEQYGITNYMTRNTLYGDWSCTTFDLNTKEPIGQFCADAGMVSVFLLDEVLRYNPDFDLHINNPWTTTWIKNFKGTVQFVVKEHVGTYEEDTKWWKKGDTYTDYSVEVVGHGINKITKEPIDFVGKQTGF